MGLQLLSMGTLGTLLSQECSLGLCLLHEHLGLQRVKSYLLWMLRWILLRVPHKWLTLLLNLLLLLLLLQLWLWLWLRLLLLQSRLMNAL